ncbi:MAG: NOL1/NOP2/sun family putative RNA methylase [Lachnospiraceae bacterium]|jgi:NOL1/NOP2/sun family putative RNA methylase|nr:NOL1/NOP2/sun family putative RNA methylase [Lachnospiraceae bacterium]
MNQQIKSNTILTAPAALPEPFLVRMKALLKDDWESFLSSYEKPHVQGLRLNALKGEPSYLAALCGEKFQLKEIPWVSMGYYYPSNQRPGKHPYHDAGLYYIQEPSAMSPVQLLNPVPGDICLDLCAAPGGKSTQIASALKGRGLLVSNEIHPARAKILSQNLERMGAANIVVTNHDSKYLADKFPKFFDKIVVDAPCSGEGMFRKDQKACQEWSLSNVALCHNRQQEILNHAAEMLKPGGRMVYSTCTFAPEENEGSVACFLKSHPDFSLEAGEFFNGYCEFGKGNPEWVSEEIQNPDLEKTIRIWPHQTEGEGHFLALLKKEEKGSGEADKRAEGTIRKNHKREGNRKADQKQPPKPEMEEFIRFCGDTLKSSERGSGNWFPWEEIPGRYLIFGDQLYYIHEAFPDITGIKVLRPGLHLGTFKKKRFEPSHGMALFLKPRHVLHTVHFAYDSIEILQYLKGESISAFSEQEEWKGWTLVAVDGFSIGWAKQTGSLLKNHYPKGLRW